MLGRWPALCLVVAALALAACGGGGGNSHKVAGVIIDVKATSLTQLDSFTLRTNDGRTLVFSIAPDAARDPQQGFVAGHLRSHLLATSKVEISYRKEGDQLLAVTIRDL